MGGHGIRLRGQTGGRGSLERTRVCVALCMSGATGLKPQRRLFQELAVAGKGKKEGEEGRPAGGRGGKGRDGAGRGDTYKVDHGWLLSKAARARRGGVFLWGGRVVR